MAAHPVFGHPTPLTTCDRILNRIGVRIWAHPNMGSAARPFFVYRGPEHVDLQQSTDPTRVREGGGV
jgi:hypothetical protein